MRRLQFPQAEEATSKISVPGHYPFVLRAINGLLKKLLGVLNNIGEKMT